MPAYTKYEQMFAVDGQEENMTENIAAEIREDLGEARVVGYGLPVKDD
jgi:hypothetical protein